MATSYSDREIATMQKAGGKCRYYGKAEVWDFGWVNFDDRTDEQNKQCDLYKEQYLKPFHIVGTSNDTDRADVTKFWKSTEVTSALGFPYTGTHQKTGSCVGAGGGNAASSICFREIVVDRDQERPILFFYPFTYGRSRLRAGMRGRGEGSTGTAWMEAATKDGGISNEHAQCPKPIDTNDGIVWGPDVEMAWSAGDQSPCTSMLEEGKKHLIKTASQMRSSEDVWKALVNGYALTCASMYAFKANVEDNVLIGRREGSWSHQMSLLACWKHPQFGPIYWLHNQWGLNAHGRCPSGMPLGGAWILEKDVDWICRTGEVFAFRFFEGYFSALDMDWFRI